MRRHLACAVLALCCWCGPAQAADEAEQRPSVTREERLLLKKWGLAYCLSTYAHAGRLSTLAAEAAERLYAGQAALFDARAAGVRAFMAARVRDRMPCKNGENGSLIACLNAAEQLGTAVLTEQPVMPAVRARAVRPGEEAAGQRAAWPQAEQGMGQGEEPTTPARRAARVQLKKFALAACLRTHATAGRADAGRGAMERARAAFRGDLGLHVEDAPYRRVEEAVDSLSCAGGNGVLCCLDALETETFAALIRAQDSYAPEPSAETLEELRRGGHL